MTLERFTAEVRAADPERFLRFAEQNATVFERLIENAPELERFRRYARGWRGLAARGQALLNQNIWNGVELAAVWVNQLHGQFIREPEIVHPRGQDFVEQLFQEYTGQI
jgi:hypothetical protein